MSGWFVFVVGGGAYVLLIAFVWALMYTASRADHAAEKLHREREVP